MPLDVAVATGLDSLEMGLDRLTSVSLELDDPIARHENCCGPCWCLVDF